MSNTRTIQDFQNDGRYFVEGNSVYRKVYAPFNPSCRKSIKRNNDTVRTDKSGKFVTVYLFDAKS